MTTSGQNDPWTEGEVTPGGTSATITVTTATKYQAWHGMGGTFNEKGWIAMKSLSEQDRQLAMNLLFSKTDGAHFTWGRIPIGASDYAASRYTLCDTESPDMSAFSITRDQMDLMPFVQAAQAVKSDIRFWGSPWTPPPWMKDNDAYDKGSMINTPENLASYAQYFVKWIQAYEAAGIHIDHVHPQNEPGWQQNYPSCAWGPSSETSGAPFMGNFVQTHLIPALSAASLDTDVWYGTLSRLESADEYWGNLTDKSLVKGVGLQWETIDFLDDVTGTANLPADFIIMQSEHRCGNYPWKGVDNGDGSYSSNAASKEAADANTFWDQEAPNNFNYALETWDLMKQWIKPANNQGVNVYSAWNMVLDTGGFSLDEVRPWPQNALLAVNTQTGTLIQTPAYFVFRHMSQYVDVGSTRVAATGGDAFAFQNPDGSVVVIMHNSGQAEAATTLSIDGTMMQFTIPERGWATVNWQG